MKRSVALLAALALAACTDRAPAPDGAALASGASASVVGGDSLAPAIDTPAPVPFAQACIVGDPAEGRPWRIDSITATAIALEPIEALASRDSARLAARLARAVDALPSDTAVADFRGLPVTVRAAWRAVLADGDTIIVAFVARRVPIESAPLEESFTLVAAPGARGGDALTERWVLREVGLEDALVARDLAGAWLVADSLHLGFTEEVAGGMRMVLVTRRAGVWAVEWSGARRTCGAP